MELRLGMDEEPTEILWVRIKGKTGDIMLGVFYRLSDRKTEWVEASIDRW